MQLATLTNPNAPNASAAQAGISQSNIDEDQNRTNVEFQNFLELLTAQLRNQDPLSPLDSTQFVAQLASFSTVEQLVNANTRLDSIASSLVNDAIDQYAGLIGKQAEVNSSDVTFSGDRVKFRINGNSESDRVEIVIADSNGAEQTRFIGQNSVAIQGWDGSTPNGRAPAGQYRIFAEYFSGDEFVGAENASTFGTISEVRLTNEGAIFRLENGATIDLDELVGLANDDDE